jgi:hypothetical protein
MKNLLKLFCVISLVFTGFSVRAASGDPRALATAARAVKLRGDFKDALLDAGPKLGLTPDDMRNILENLESMVPREGLLNPWRESNTYLKHLPNALGGVSKNEFPSVIKLCEGILIIEKAKTGENTSLTAFYSAEVTDVDAESQAAKDAKKLAKNSGWAYRFVMKSRLKVGSNGDDSVTVKPIYLLRYIDEMPKFIQIYNDAMMYIRGDCTLKQDMDITVRDSGVFGADNLNVKELVVNQRKNTMVNLRKGSAKLMEAVVDGKSSLLAEGFEADAIEMNLSRNHCREVVVNPKSKLVVIGKLKTGTFRSVNPAVKAEKGSVALQNIENMGERTEKAVVTSLKALTFGVGFMTWKIVAMPFKIIGSVLKRLSKAKVVVGGSMKVGPVNAGAGLII